MYRHVATALIPVPFALPIGQIVLRYSANNNCWLQQPCDILQLQHNHNNKLAQQKIFLCLNKFKQFKYSLSHHIAKQLVPSSRSTHNVSAQCHFSNLLFFLYYLKTFFMKSLPLLLKSWFLISVCQKLKRFLLLIYINLIVHDQFLFSPAIHLFLDCIFSC